MTREQVINYLYSSGFSEEQVNTIVKAFEPTTNKALDTIRNEIGKVYEELDGYDPDSLGAFLARIDDIFDKYKAESEDNNADKEM